MINVQIFSFNCPLDLVKNASFPQSFVLPTLFITTFTINMDTNELRQLADISVSSTLTVTVGYEPYDWSFLLVVTKIKIMFVVEVKLVGPDRKWRKFGGDILWIGLKVSMIHYSISITSEAECSVEYSIYQGPVYGWILVAKTERFANLFRTSP